MFADQEGGIRCTERRTVESNDSVVQRFVISVGEKLVELLVTLVQLLWLGGGGAATSCSGPGSLGIQGGQDPQAVLCAGRRRRRLTLKLPEER